MKYSFSDRPSRRHAGRSKTGFTVVELLVVIAIIAILTTIVALNYGNATKTARTSQAKSNAYTVQKIAESFYADKNRVPGTIGDFSYNSLVKVPDGVTILTDGAKLSSANGQTSVEYAYIGSASAASGGRIRYWDYDIGTITTTPLYVGTASGSSSNWQSL